MDAPANYQNEIYFEGLAQQRPAYPISMKELEKKAYESMSETARGYVAGGAGSGYTMRANREAFHKWRLVPRMLRDVETRDLSVDLFGEKLDHPVLLAPIGVQSIVHDEGELAVARAAGAAGVPIIQSTAATHSMEEVADANGGGRRWYQLYWPREHDITKSFLKRAEEAGYEAIVVTLDTSMLAWRPFDLQAAYLPFLIGQGIANYITDPAFCSVLEKSPQEDMGAAVMRWVQIFSNPGHTWDDLEVVRKNTSLPVLLKGILHPADARKAADMGIDGIIVSNHGGRQVDGSISTLEALPPIVEALPQAYPVLMDSGIRTGVDAVKALALGATAVCLGRPFIWGLTLGGEEGVRQVLRSFLAELDLTLALCGQRSVSNIDRELLDPAG